MSAVDQKDYRSRALSYAELHGYCRELEDAAYRYCERSNIDAHELVEGGLPFIFHRRWQLVAENLLKGFSRHFPPSDAELLREIGYQYILNFGNTSVRSVMIH